METAIGSDRRDDFFEDVQNFRVIGSDAARFVVQFCGEKGDSAFGRIGGRFFRRKPFQAVVFGGKTGIDEKLHHPAGLFGGNAEFFLLYVAPFWVRDILRKRVEDERRVALLKSDGTDADDIEIARVFGRVCRAVFNGNPVQLRVVYNGDGFFAEESATGEEKRESEKGEKEGKR